MMIKYRILFEISAFFRLVFCGNRTWHPSGVEPWSSRDAPFRNGCAFLKDKGCKPGFPPSLVLKEISTWCHLFRSESLKDANREN